MRNILLIAFFSVNFNTVWSQSNQAFLASYQTTTLDKNSSGIGKTFLNNIKYTFYTDELVCFLEKVEVIHFPNLNATNTGEDKIYINYKNASMYHDLEGRKAYGFEEMKFEKVDSGEKILGYETNKYKSGDGNIILYTTSELPWYIQPCSITANLFNEAIIKLVNLKSKYQLELIDYVEIDPTEEHRGTRKKILNKKTTFKKMSIRSPFMQ